MGKLDALSLSVDVPPDAYNISVAVGLIAAILVGESSKEILCPKASTTTRGVGVAVGTEVGTGIGFVVGVAVGTGAGSALSAEHPVSPIINKHKVNVINNFFKIRSFNLYKLTRTANLTAV